VDQEQKQAYKEKYLRAKAKGVKFYPDIVYKDFLVAFALFLLLVGLAIFVGVANEPKADPSDSSYIPRPEWYFLFLFEMLKYVPPQVEWIGAAVIPGVVVLLLLVLPLIDRNPHRWFGKRKIAISIMTVIMVGIVGLTVMAVVTTPPQEESETLATTLSESILIGQDLYSVNCVECHGADGEGGEIKGVEGLEGVVVKPISSQDEMYTRSDTTLTNIISYGQPSLGMPPFSKTYGGELGPGEVEAIVNFMRYTWDDRAELPEEVKQASAIPSLGPDEVPSYEIHIAPLVKRYCLSCHRPGKKNNNYLMATYEEIMTSGDNAPNNVIPGDLTSILIRVINREDLKDLEFPVGPMPPTKSLPEEVIAIFERWVAGGAPNTAADAAAISPPAGGQPGAATPAASPAVAPGVTLTNPPPTAAPTGTP
jgi:mono/diheme cytochrome c family protein